MAWFFFRWQSRQNKSIVHALPRPIPEPTETLRESAKMHQQPVTPMVRAPAPKPPGQVESSSETNFGKKKLQGGPTVRDTTPTRNTKKLGKGSSTVVVAPKRGLETAEPARSPSPRVRHQGSYRQRLSELSPARAQSYRDQNPAATSRSDSMPIEALSYGNQGPSTKSKRELTSYSGAGTRSREADSAQEIKSATYRGSSANDHDRRSQQIRQGSPNSIISLL